MLKTIVEHDWYAEDADTALRVLETTMDGLSAEVVEDRLRVFGHNEFKEGQRRGYARIIFDQFKSPLVFILLIAGSATFLLHEYADTIVILIVIFINTAIGLYQEGRAEQAFEKLRDSQKNSAIVIRNGRKQRIDSTLLVPGDIISLSAGEVVPADARLLDVYDFKTSEAALTGEWLAVNKQIEPRDDATRITSQDNMVFMGTLVSSGTGTAVVVRTGSQTQVGAIAKDLSTDVTSSTPFQRSIKRLARHLGILVLVATTLIFIIGLLRGESLQEMLLLSIAIAVAAIPSGLPVAVTVVLAIGLEAILRQGGLIKNLVATETLGSATVIITDKTGTLTEAKMSVAKIITKEKRQKDADRALLYAILASDAFVERTDATNKEGVLNDTSGYWHVEGRPVERAVVLEGIKRDINQNELWSEYCALDYRPFSSSTRYAARLIQGPQGRFISVSGSPELFVNATTVLDGDLHVRFDSSTKDRLIAKHKQLAMRGMRFIAVAYKEVSLKTTTLPPTDELLDDLTFGGYIGLDDPVRPDVFDAIQTAKIAGTDVIMATGDFAPTAGRIAEDVGIVGTVSRIVTGEEFQDMTEDERKQVARDVKVFARMLPAQKLELLRILQARGEVVAMTGDGINDAPALVNADIGIALGGGTEVAKEASDLVLLNNSFSIIVRAIKEGRRILDNLKKIVAYLLSTAFGEIVVVGGSFVFGLPIPILPTQILWTNIVEEGFMTVAFAFEPTEPDVMKRDPRSLDMRQVLTKNLKIFIAAIALITGIFLLVLYVYLLRTGLPIEHVRTIIFAGLSVDSLFYTFSLKHLHHPLLRTNIFSNRYLLLAFFASLSGLLLALFFPPLRSLLSLVPLTGPQYLLIFCVGVFNLITIEVAKYILIKR
ncbi:MAG: HAD-IC family P-type ATPase [bacterium]|nr:HAD-IC family P-type ATPase [bacterium]